MAGKTVLILGGGMGGLVAAGELRKRLGREHRVVIVEKSLRHVFAPSLLWVMTGGRRPERITRDLRRMLPAGVEVIEAQVLAVEPEKQKVKTDARELGYDYLVIALGAELAPETLPGYLEAAHNFYTLEGATALADVLKTFTGGRIAVAVSRMPYKCPAAPYEAALLLHDVFRRRGLLEQIDIQLFTIEGQPMPVAGPVVGRMVETMLEEKGIGFHPKMHLLSIDPDRKELKFEGGATAAFDLLVAVPPHRAPRMLGEAGLGNEAGWVPVDRHTLQTSYENVYAVGDVTSVTLAGGKPLPKAGVFAHAEAKVVAANIAAAIGQSGTVAKFDGLGYCWLEMGGGVAGFASGSFYAEPEPVVELAQPGRMWHWGKVLFESYWLGGGLRRAASRLILGLGSKLFRVDVSL